MRFLACTQRTAMDPSNPILLDYFRKSLRKEELLALATVTSDATDVYAMINIIQKILRTANLTSMCPSSPSRFSHPGQKLTSVYCSNCRRYGHAAKDCRSSQHIKTKEFTGPSVNTVAPKRSPLTLPLAP